ncbi:MAG: methyltransferase domain-containing protein [Leucobacter sp.]
MKLSEREPSLRELMEDPECDPERLRRTMERFETVNRAVSRWGAVYRSLVRPALTSLTRPARVLDIGCGGGDVLRRIVKLARRDGFEVEGLGIDPDPRGLDVAEQATPLAGVTYRQAYSRELVDEGAEFEIVISNHLLHHLGAAELNGLISDSEALAARLCVHSDIARSRLAYLGFAVGAAPLAPGSFIRVDGLRSIRRSYTRAELEARLPDTWDAKQPYAFRVLAVYEPEGVSL